MASPWQWQNIVSVHYSASALCVSCIVTEMGDWSSVSNDHHLKTLDTEARDVFSASKEQLSRPGQRGRGHSWTARNPKCEQTVITKKQFLQLIDAALIQKEEQILKENSVNMEKMRRTCCDKWGQVRLSFSIYDFLAALSSSRSLVVCPSVHRSVRPSVGPSVGSSVGPSVGPSVCRKTFVK